MTNSNARLTRWAMALQQYSFTVRYRLGKENGNADGLSRQPWGDREDMQPPRMEGGGGGSVGTSKVRPNCREPLPHWRQQAPAL